MGAQRHDEPKMGTRGTSGFCQGLAGCDGRSPVGPTPPPAIALSVTAIAPQLGSTSGTELVTMTRYWVCFRRNSHTRCRGHKRHRRQQHDHYGNCPSPR